MKQRFMLDTNYVRVLFERRSPRLDQWLSEESCSLSAIVAAEIRFSLARQVLFRQRASLVSDLFDILLIETFDAQVASTYDLLRPELQRLGLFGSYGRGTAAFGSDLDLILVDAGARGGQVERTQQWPLAEMPFSCNALVLTPAEQEQRLNDGSCMVMELKRDLRWLL